MTKRIEAHEEAPKPQRVRRDPTPLEKARADYNVALANLDTVQNECARSLTMTTEEMIERTERAERTVKIAANAVRRAELAETPEVLAKREAEIEAIEHDAALLLADVRRLEREELATLADLTAKLRQAEQAASDRVKALAWRRYQLEERSKDAGVHPDLVRVDAPQLLGQARASGSVGLHGPLGGAWR